MMGKITLDYAFSDDVLMYGTISNGFKSGGYNGANSNTTLQLQPIKEEVLTAYELGLKATLLEGAMQLNAAAFFYDYEDKQEQDAAVAFVGNISGLTNVPKSEITGAELEMQWAPAEGWHFRLGVAVLDAEITEWMAVDREASSWTCNTARSSPKSGLLVPTACWMPRLTIVIRTVRAVVRRYPMQLQVSELPTRESAMEPLMVSGEFCCGAGTSRTSITTRPHTMAVTARLFGSTACRKPGVYLSTTSLAHTKRKG
jgi:hypothetical protein